MALHFSRFVELPKNINKGGFDHAAFSERLGRIYVAHTANDTLDVIDVNTDQYLHSISNLIGVAGALVSDEENLLFTSNRGENTVSIFNLNTEKLIHKINVGIRPNGLAFDSKSKTLLCGNVGTPDDQSSYSLSVIDTDKGIVRATILTPGRSRWMVYDNLTDSFYVNIGTPSKIAVIKASAPEEIFKWIDIPAVGPHGLDIDSKAGYLYCACDDGTLITLDINAEKIISKIKLSGAPDVIFLSSKLNELYVAIGEPGVIDIFDTRKMQLRETIKTEVGTHTIGYSWHPEKVYAFFPNTHKASVYKLNE